MLGILEGNAMFDNLEQQIKHDDAFSLKFRIPVYELLIISLVTVCRSALPASTVFPKGTGLCT